jgi:glutamate-1-semialdehyde 2,1-aminomutase
MSKSERLFAEAKKYIPGGVNSPVRAFGSIGGVPRFIKSADGAYIYDVDGNEYIDYVCSWGPMILGHNRQEVRNAVIEASKNGLSFGAVTEVETEMAKLITEMIPSVEMVRMVNSGTEAVMSAVRVARGYTGRNKIIKFNGCYHGHSDGLLVKAGSGIMTAGVPDSSGVPEGYTQYTLTADYNNLDSVRALYESNPGEIAAIIVEPVAANMGVVVPEKGFLEGLRAICDEYGSLLIFDEVITGFRLSEAGAQGYFGVQADLATYGKIIGAGMPVGAYGGRREVMSVVSPLGSVYQAGTLSGNPVAMSAGLAQLKILHNNPQWYDKLNDKSSKFFGAIEDILMESGRHYSINYTGSLGSIFFTDKRVKDYAGAKTSDTAAFASYCNYMLDHGIYCAPSQFEAMFISMAHTDGELNHTLDVIRDYFRK